MAEKPRPEDLHIQMVRRDPARLIFSPEVLYTLHHGNEQVGNIKIERGEGDVLYWDNLFLRPGYRGPITDQFVSHALQDLFNSKPSLHEVFFTADPQVDNISEAERLRLKEHLYARYGAWGAERLQGNPNWSHRMTRDAVLKGPLSKVAVRIPRK